MMVFDLITSIDEAEPALKVADAFGWSSKVSRDGEGNTIRLVIEPPATADRRPSLNNLAVMLVLLEVADGADPKQYTRELEENVTRLREKVLGS